MQPDSSNPEIDRAVPPANAFRLDTLDFAKQGGLLPAIVQDARTHRVLMLGYMDRAAVEATLATDRKSVV